MGKETDRLQIKKIGELNERYKIRFGKYFDTESLGSSLDDLIAMMEYCIKEGKTYEELTGDYYEDDMDY